MNKVRAIQTWNGLYLFSALILVLSTLSPVVSPVQTADGPPTRELSSSMYRVLPDWRQASLLPTNYALGSSSTTRSLPTWLPPIRPIAGPETRALAQTVTGILVVDSSDTTIVTQTLSTDETFTFFAVDRDDTSSRQVVTWTLSSPVGTLSPTVNVSTTLDATIVGTATLMATLVTTPDITTTAFITVTPGLAARLSLSPTNQTIAAGQAQSYSATAYDQNNNLVGDVTASTTFTIASAALGNWSNHVYTSEIAGQWAITGTFPVTPDQHITGTATLTVNPDVLSTIVVAPDQVTLTVGYTQVFTATGVDQFGNSVSVSPNWTTNWGLMNPTLGVTSVFTADTTPAVGRLVTATQNSISGTAGVDVIHGPVQTFYISPSQIMTQTAGAGFRLEIEAQDEHGNRATRYHNRTAYLTDTTRTTRPTLLPFTDGSWSGVITITGAAPSVVITVTDAATTGLSNGFTVLPAELRRLELAGYPPSTVAGELLLSDVTVRAYDVYGNLKTNYTGTVHFDSSDALADLPSNYTFDEIDDAGVHDFSGGNFALFRAPTQTISVEDLTTGISQTSSVIDVEPAVLYTFTLGHIDAEQEAGVAFTLTIEPFDEWGNAKTSYDQQPSLSDTTGTLLPTQTQGCTWDSGSCVQSVVITRAWNSVRITVADPGGVSQWSNPFNVSPAPLDHIRINRAADNGGESYAYPVEVGDQDMTIYMTYMVWAAGYDRFDNFREDLSVNWGLTDILAAGGIVANPDLSATFTPAPILSGTGRITATYVPSGFVDSTGLFTIRAPRLVISKDDIDDIVPAGGTLRYTVHYTNVGNAAVPSVRITETYDPRVDFAWAAPWPSQGDNVWMQGGLGPGEAYAGFFLVEVDVNNSLEPSTVLTNLISISGPRLGEYTFTETTVVTSHPDLVLTLDSAPNPAFAGNNLVYQIQYANHGNAPVHNVYITMTYDADVTFSSSDPAPESGTDNVWYIETVPADDTGAIDVTVVVADYMLDQDALVSTATIKSDEWPESSVSEYTVVNAPDLVLNKVASPDPAVAFNPLIYTLIFTNVGHMASGGLVITDAVPTRTQYVSCQGAPCSDIAGIVTWNLENGLLPDESASVTTVVDVDRNPDPGTVLINQARVRVFDTPEYAAFAQITTTVVSTPSLWLSISNGTDAVEAGEELVYALTYDNTGSGNAYNTTIVVTPPSSQHVDDIGCSPSAICQVNGGTVTYDVGVVAGGERGAVNMFATLRDPLPAGARVITASATIDTATPGDPPVGNSAQDVDEIATRPDLQIQVGYHNWTPYPDKRLTYTLYYSNTGHIATTGVVITARQPQYTTYDPAASSAWQSVGDGMYIYQVGALGYPDAGSLRFVVTLPTGIFTTDMSNFDAAFGIFDDGGSGEDGNPNNNSAPAPLGVPDIVVEDVDVDWEGLLSHESGRYFTVTLKNQGTQIACNPVPGPRDPPDYCAPFYIDLYINPDPAPPSMPIGEPFGEAFTRAGPIYPGESRLYLLSPFSLPMTATLPLVLWARVDNFLEARIYGLVPEYDESNNVFGPVTMEIYLYLPMLLRGY